jgi:hypothetical protein
MQPEIKKGVNVDGENIKKNQSALVVGLIWIGVRRMFHG